MFEVQVIQFGTKNDDDPFKPFLNLRYFTSLPNHNQALISYRKYVNKSRNLNKSCILLSKYWPKLHEK